MTETGGLRGLIRGPRRQLVQAKREELRAVAEEFRAAPLLLTGSVARGEEAEEGERPDKPSASDIDFYVPNFSSSGDALRDRENADLLVAKVRTILAPHPVDLRPLPGWPADPPQLAGFARDAIQLEDLA